MTNKRNLSTEAKVGVFVVLVVVGLIYLTTQINSTGFSLKQQNRYYVEFDNVSGLIARTPVEYAGIRVGHVDKISLDKGQVVVEVLIDPEISIYEDTTIGLQTRGLLGEKIIMMEGGGQGAVIPSGGRIKKAAGSKSFDEAVANFSELSEEIKNLIKGGQGKPSIKDIISNTTDITEDFKNVMRGKKGEVEALISNMKEISEGLKDFVRSDSEGLKEIAQSLKQTLERVDRIVARVEKGEGTVGKLLSDDSTVEKMNETLDGVNEFVGQVKQLEIALGFRSEYMGSEGEPIAVTSFRFKPAYDKYFLLELTDGPIRFGNRRKTVTTTTLNPPGTTITEEEEVQGDNFTITAIYARRFWDLTISAGLIRSSGGIGLEYHLFKDRLSLAAQAFDFSRTENPHLRAVAKLNLLDHIFYLNGGVDDILHDDDRRNFFAGAGFFLTDEDVKKIFGLVPLATSR